MNETWTLANLEKYLSSKIHSLQILSDERELVNKERFNASEKAVSAALVAVEKSNTAALVTSEKAILKAEAAQEKRNEASNEIRAAMVDQQRNFAAKSETDFRFTSVEKILEELKNTQAQQMGKAQGTGASAIVIVQIVTSLSSIFAIIGVIFLLIKS